MSGFPMPDTLQHWIATNLIKNKRPNFNTLHYRLQKSSYKGGMPKIEYLRLIKI